MLVFFDLPVVTAKEKKDATKFRKFLLKDGYNMVQWSVYSRICNGMDAVAMHKQRLKQNLPLKGSVRALVLTEKQYESMEIMLGTKTFDDTPESIELMEAHVALMELENVRILKEMRNSVNRKVNCETANINKTVSAAVKQVEDITYLRDMIGFENMPDNLVEAAYARLDHPDATLKELGESLTPPVGKSGINHRLRKLSEMAESLRQKQGGLL